ncbi:Kelch repeat-containing protein [Paraburkholderia aspalathi]|uniref:Kelch repeat-containing protein n=1 Tax=Paraburkholderia aspalathi TaxID=1324617 RepID=UPI0038B80708
MKISYRSRYTILAAAGILSLAMSPVTVGQQSRSVDTPLLEPMSVPPEGLSEAGSSAIQGGTGTHVRKRSISTLISTLISTTANSATQATNNCSTGFARYAAFKKSWTSETSAPTAREGYGVARGADGLIYYFGGDNCDNVILNTTEAYDENSNRWSTGYPADRVARTNVSAVAGENGLIYVVGGHDASGRVLNLVETYDPRARVWAKAPDLPTARDDPSSVLGPDNKIYVAGGKNQSGQDLSVVEAFDPASGTWQSASPMPEGRSEFGFDEGPDKQLNVLGGHSNGSSLATVDSYDVTTNTWFPRLNLDAPRVGAGVVENDLGNTEIIAGLDPAHPSANPAEEIDFSPSPNSAAHTLVYYLHGPEVAPDEGGSTMDENLPQTSNQPLELNLLGGKSWYSHLALSGEFGSTAEFFISVPCGSLGASLLTSFTLYATQPDGSSPRQLGTAGSLLGVCTSGAQTVQIPASVPVTLNNELLKLTMSSLFSTSLNVPAGQAVTLQAIGFSGSQY